MKKNVQIESTTPEKKSIKPAKNRIVLWNGEELQFHCPRPKTTPVNLASFVPAEFANTLLEVEIGPGKGEFIAARAKKFRDRFFMGIDRRVDRVRLSEKKLVRVDQSEPATQKNWIVIKEDARCFLEAGIPPLDGLHLYQPDPWPKDRQNKHRFFRSPDARQWACAIKQGGFFSFSTDHRGYFEEMIQIVKTWEFLEMNWAWKKTHLSGPPSTHFEGIFLKQQKPVFKAVYTKL